MTSRNFGNFSTPNPTTLFSNKAYILSSQNPWLLPALTSHVIYGRPLMLLSFENDGQWACQLSLFMKTWFGLVWVLFWKTFCNVKIPKLNRNEIRGSGSINFNLIVMRNYWYCLIILKVENVSLYKNLNAFWKL